MRRLFIAVGRVVRRTHALLAQLWDYCRLGIRQQVRYQGFLYAILPGVSGLEVHILDGRTCALLGKVVDGLLYQAA